MTALFSTEDKEMLHRLALLFRAKNEALTFQEIKSALFCVSEDHLRETLCYLVEKKAVKSCSLGNSDEVLYWTAQLEVWNAISKEGRNQRKLRKHIESLLKSTITPSLKDKFTQKTNVIRQDIEVLTERIAAWISTPTSDTSEPPLKKRKLVVTDQVLEAKRLQAAKELEEIEADIERWRGYVLSISTELCARKMVSVIQLVRVLGVDLGKARNYGVDLAFED